MEMLRRLNVMNKVDLEGYQDYVSLGMRTFKGQPVMLPLKDMLQRCVMGLTEEAGEVSGVVKKGLFYPINPIDGVSLDLTDEARMDLLMARAVDELGDVLWYVAAICSCLGVGIDYVMEENIIKLENRHNDSPFKPNVDGDKMESRRCQTLDEVFPKADGIPLRPQPSAPQPASGKEFIQYEGGGCREDKCGKGHYTSLSAVAMRRLAERYEYGDVEHGDANWKTGLPASGCVNSIFRHLLEYLDGDDVEDHLAAVAWNASALMEFEINQPQFIDIPARRGKGRKHYPLPQQLHKK